MRLKCSIKLNLGNNLESIKKTAGGKEIPEEYYLSNAYPNPFNPTTQIKFSILKDEFVSLRVFDLLGREVAILVNEAKPAGVYTYSFDASYLSSGIYFYSISAGKFSDTKKMILIR